jgi:hypothetical protein
MLSRISNFSGPKSTLFGKKIQDVSTPLSLKLLILGDSSVSDVSNSINNRLIELGYSEFTINTQELSINYEGTGLSPEDYTTILMYTNGGDYGSPNLSNNLNNYMDSGGNFVTAVFMWNIKPTGFDYNRTTFQGDVSQSYRSGGGNMIIDVEHPITSGILLDIGDSWENTVTNLTTGSTKIATSPTGRPLIGIRDVIRKVGSHRISSINSFPPMMNTNMINLLTNCILWSNGNI